MTIDINEHISAVRRQVGTRTLKPARPGSSRSPAPTVPRSTTSGTRARASSGSPAGLPITGDLRVGGRYQLQATRRGRRALRPAAVVRRDLEFGGDVSSIEVRFDPAPAGGTVLTLEHVGHVDDEFWDRSARRRRPRVGRGPARPGRAPGLAGVVKPADAEAWAVSDEGRAFMTLSAERWCDAHIAAGGDPAAAAASAARTAAFYTGAESADEGRRPARASGRSATFLSS